MERYSHFIDGEPRPAGAWRPVFEPASAEVYAEGADGGETEVLEAVEAAEQDMRTWAAGRVTKGRMSQEDVDAALGRLRFTTDQAEILFHSIFILACHFG